MHRIISKYLEKVISYDNQPDSVHFDVVFMLYICLRMVSSGICGKQGY